MGDRVEAASSYGTFARARVKDLPVRLGLALFLAVTAWVLTRGAGALIWSAVVIAGQSLDLWISSSMLRRPDVAPSLGRRCAYGASLAVNAVIYSSIAAYLWFYGGNAGKAFAILQPAGSLLNVSLQLDRSPKLLRAVWISHAVFLVGLPVVFGLMSGPLLPMLVLSMGGVVYIGHIVVAVHNAQQGAQGLRTARDLAEAERERAEQASAAKSDFLATMSHEIRTPMNGVLSAAALLRGTTLTEAQAAHVDMLANASEVLLGLLNDVLDVSKIESGQMVITPAPFELIRKLEATVQLWRPRTDEKQIGFSFDAGDLPERITTDPLRFQQIVFNLIANAVKFTAQGHVHVRGGRSISDDDGQPIVWIEIEDTGCGMDAATLGRAFRTFEQASGGATRAHGGSGLGLPISLRLAELLGGSLSAQSEVGRGSIFRFETPLIEAEAEIQAPPQAAAPVRAGSPPQVLLAEDHEVNQRIVRLILEPSGCHVTVVANGQAAVSAAAERPFDVILMDMQMPVMGGIEATSLIKSGRGLNAATPIIALTANALDEHRAQWAAVGVDVFMTKPVDMPSLIENVWQAAAGRADMDADSLAQSA
jgi:signal transduction histidine kinase/ActR/RegA family two-component response regulator